MDERVRFIQRLRDGERMSDLCAEYGISRKTGYKYKHRFSEMSYSGLSNQSRRPKTSGSRVDEAIRALLIDTRKEHPTWGPKKLKAYLQRLRPDLHLPTHSTIGGLLGKAGLLSPTPRRRRATYTSGSALRVTHAPNELWCVDFKGQFRLTSGAYCYPLTVTDHFSRMLLCCDALDSTQGLPVQRSFEMLFKTYGLPAAIRSDNGGPFASTGLMGLTPLSVWWLRLGIALERIEPGHPEQNGRHERMHLTLKQETTRPAAPNGMAQQERFDKFRHQYNTIRPHEALGMATPHSLYTPSEVPFPAVLAEPDYRLEDDRLQVDPTGCLRRRGGGRVYLSVALSEQWVGLREVESDRWLVRFMGLELGFWDMRTKRFEAIHPTWAVGEATVGSEEAAR